MVHAFVAVSVGAGTAVETIAERIRAVEPVKRAHVVAGDVDVMVELEVDETYQAMTAVADGIRSLDAVTDTTTYVSLG